MQYVHFVGFDFRLLKWDSFRFCHLRDRGEETQGEGSRRCAPLFLILSGSAALLFCVNMRKDIG